MTRVKHTRLGDLLNLKRGYDLTEAERVPGPYPVVSSSGISGYHNEFKVQEPGVVIGRYGTLGEAHYLEERYWPHNTSLYVTDFKGNSPRYIYYLLTCLGRIKTSDKSAVPGINRNELHEMAVPAITDPVAQTEIAEVLRTLDAKIQLNNQINHELEGMAKLLYDYWFVQFDFPITPAEAAAMGKPRLEGKPYRDSGGKMVFHEGLKREIPSSWGTIALGDFAENFDSRRVPLSKAEREKRPGQIPYYGATGVMGYVDDHIFDGEFILLAEDGSVMNEQGFPVTQFIFGKSWVNNHAHVLRAVNPKDNEFLLLSLSRIPVISIMTGSNQKKITQENLNAVELVKPSDETLGKYSDFAVPIRKQRINIEMETQALTELRDWLLPMLMSGQVSVS